MLKMAKIDNMFTFVMKHEAGLPESYFDRTLDDQFERAKKTGFAHDPADAGGATMVGVTLETFKDYRRRMGMIRPSVDDLKNISFDHWSRIVKTMYWDRIKGDQINDQAVANMIFDWVWASGSPGIKRPQRLLNLKGDGIVGPMTINAINAADPKDLFERIRKDRVKFIDEICESSVRRFERKIGRQATEAEKMRHTNERFRKGWLRRIDDVANIK